MKKIAFMSNQLGERGTEVALYDYAHFNENILGNSSIVLYYKDHYFNCDEAIKKFKERFNVFAVESKDEIDSVLLDNNIDIFYYQHGGGYNDGFLSNITKNCVHAVFGCSQAHGDVYASISPYVPGNDGSVPTVPYMVNLPENLRNMREELGIPTQTVVFGGYGGRDSFNVTYAQEAVYEVAKENPKIYFLFANFDQFSSDLPNIIYLPRILNLERKVEFINSIDAMIWARNIGETYGLAIAEFSSKNKPVIAGKFGWGQAHVKFLGDKGIWYEDKESLKNIFTDFDQKEAKTRDWNAFQEFTPENVMTIFRKVFID
ncbi:MAG: hypothetical protein ACI9FD_002361 [Gammaproteobacteria bacterium]|jgi:hypothetical protein